MPRTTQRTPSSANSFMERFSLSQVCIFKPGTLRGPFELWWQNTALTLWKQTVSQSNPPLKTSGADSIFTHYSKHLWPASGFSEETLCLDLLTGMSSPKTILGQNALYGFGSTTKRKTSSHYFFHGKVLLVPNNNINFGTLQGNTLSVNLATGDGWQKDCGYPVKARMFHFWTHLVGLFGFWFSHHYSQFLAQATEFSEWGTMLGSPY